MERYKNLQTYISNEWYFYLFFLALPDTDRENTDDDDDSGTHRTEWTKYANNNFLRNHIAVKENATCREGCEDFCWAGFLREPSDQSYEQEDRVDDHGDHRECDLEFSYREDNRARILENSTTREGIGNITRHRLESGTICPIPVFVRRDREVYRVKNPNSGENGDDKIFFHREKSEG